MYGEAAGRRLKRSHVAVVGVGGVGSWSAEALARSGAGCISLIDFDVIAESNTNRQIHALGDEYGKIKVEAMADRIRAINPRCVVNAIDHFINPDNVESLLGKPLDALIDATDQIQAKAAMIAWCRQNEVLSIVAGAGGGKLDPTALAIADLSDVHNDRLLSRLRALLRQQYGYPTGEGGKSASKPSHMGITAVYSTQARLPYTPTSTNGKLNCAGYGSSVCVTASMGFAAAAWVMERLAGGVDR